MFQYIQQIVGDNRKVFWTPIEMCKFIEFQLVAINFSVILKAHICEKREIVKIPYNEQQKQDTCI